MTLQNCKQACVAILRESIFYLSCKIAVNGYKLKPSWSWFRLLGQGLDRLQLTSPLLWLVAGNGLLPSGVFCYVTINLTKVDSSKWCCCIISFSTSNWSISQVIPNKQVVEQMTKNERFNLHQSMKTDAVCSFSHQEKQTLLQNHNSGTKQTQLVPWRFSLHRYHENNCTLEGETQIWKNVKLWLSITEQFVCMFPESILSMIPLIPAASLYDIVLQIHARPSLYSTANGNHCVTMRFSLIQSFLNSNMYHGNMGKNSRTDWLTRYETCTVWKVTCRAGWLLSECEGSWRNYQVWLASLGCGGFQWTL